MLEVTLDEIYLIISEYNERNANKKNYNIFKVLEITEREVLMCRVLADFLNPEGAHGKGTRYLKIFLDKIIHREDYEIICDSAHVFKEYPINADRRIDIVIEARGVFIPIEVKIHAREQKAQCFDYYMYAKQKDNQTRIIYLTKWGTMPSECSLISADGEIVLPAEKVVCISFAEDICRFMEMIIEREEVPIIKEMAKQYRDAIKEFTVFVDEELQVEVANKLCENEKYFRSMIVIERAAKKAKAKLIYSVIEEFEEQFLPLLAKYKLQREAEFDWYDYRTQATEDYYAQSESTYPGLNYVFSDVYLPDGLQLWFRIEINYTLFAGICLFDADGENEVGIGNQLDNKIKEALFEYINPGEAQYQDWWIRYWYLPTAYGNVKLEKDKIPNFKEMNEAAIVLSDSDMRKKFVKECISIIDKELHRLIRCK